MKKNILLIDVESIGIEKPQVYDIGWAITDKKGRIKKTQSFIIQETFNNRELMNTAYYANKLPLYYEKLNNGEIKIKKFYDVRQALLSDITEYGVNTMSAYNLGFDSRALDYTMKTLTNGKFKKFFPKAVQEKLDMVCVWSMACQVLFIQKTYKKIATRNGWVSEKGNFRTNAEVAYRYITGKHNFIEEHTGLADVLIENEIMAKCYRQNKKFEKFHKNPWRLAQ